MELFSAENIIAFLTLTALEIVLGIDNIIFISILVEKLDAAKREFARKLGLAIAMLSRIALLFAISWVMRLTDPLFEVLAKSFSGRDLILILGGLFLLGKATVEIHHKVDEVSQHSKDQPKRPSSIGVAMVQILLLDLVFSLDSVITAVGMVKEVSIMVASIVIAVGVMMIFAKAIGDFIEKNPTFKILALSFLILVGMMLMVEGFGSHVEKGYIYFAIGFSLFVESINMRVRRAKSI